MLQLRQEFRELQTKIFGISKFVIVQNTPDNKRYDQLFQFFYPEFRTKNYINPLT